MSEPRLDAKFIQIATCADEGEGLYALDEDGVVWTFGDGGTADGWDACWDGCWHPLPTKRSLVVPAWTIPPEGRPAT